MKVFDDVVDICKQIVFVLNINGDVVTRMHVSVGLCFNFIMVFWDHIL